jgi:rare lipoprotein A
MHSNIASWYGPGFWGSRTACGNKLKRDTVGVAHKHLPCGTKVTFFAHGRWLRTKVVDRGPYKKGRKWDLTQAAAEQLNVEVTEKVRAAPIH